MESNRSSDSTTVASVSMILRAMDRQVNVEQPSGRRVQLEEPAVEEQGRPVPPGRARRRSWWRTSCPLLWVIEASGSCERSPAIALSQPPASTSCISVRCGSPKPGSDCVARHASMLLPSHDRASFRSLATPNGLCMRAA
jgi:hypothetical protein